MNKYRIHSLLFVLGALLVVVGTWAGIISPRVSQIRQADETTSQISTQNSATRREITELSELSSQIGSQRNQLESLRKHFPSSYDQSAFITSLDAAAAQSGVTIRSVSFSTATDAALPSAASGTITGNRLVQVPVSISANGTYDQLRDFVAAVQSIDRVAVPNSINFTMSSSSASASGTSGASSSASLTMACTIWSLLEKNSTESNAAVSGSTTTEGGSSSSSSSSSPAS